MLSNFFFLKDREFYRDYPDIRNFIPRPRRYFKNPILLTKTGLADSRLILVIKDYHAQFYWTPGKTGSK